MNTFRLRLPAALVLIAATFGYVASTPAADGPAESTQKLVHAFGRGDVATLWEGLPKGYQEDVEDLVEAFAKKVDAEAWDSAFKTLAKLSKTMKEKKEFVLNSEYAKGLNEYQRKDLIENYDVIVEISNALVASDISTHKGLLEVDLGDFFKETGNKIGAAYLKTGNEGGIAQAARLRKMEVKLVSVDGDEAVLDMETNGGGRKEEKYVRDEGKWLPKEIVDGWDDAIGKAKTAVAAITIEPEQKAQVMQIVKLVDGTLDQLAAAKSQEEFDTNLKSIKGLLEGLSGPKRELEKKKD